MSLSVELTRYRQIACADVLLLNKTDLVDTARIEEVEQTIRYVPDLRIASSSTFFYAGGLTCVIDTPSYTPFPLLPPSTPILTAQSRLIRRAINPTTRIQRTQQSRIPLDAMFNIQSFSDTALGAEETSTWKVTSGTRGHNHPHTHDASCNGKQTNSAKSDTCNSSATAQALHDASISSTLIPLPPLSQPAFDKLNDFLESLLWTDKLPQSLDPSGGLLSKQGIEVLRIKGLIRMAAGQGEGGREYVLQGVTDIFELKEVKSEAGQAGEVQGKIVFIGRRVNVLRDKLREHLQL
jgi:G3E family GTPase